jgi:hypothetical protein
LRNSGITFTGGSGSGRSLWCTLLRCLLDTIPGYFRRGILLRKEIEVLLSNGQLTMRGSNVSILHILCVQWLEFPVGVLLLFRVLELGDLAEYCDFLDEVLQ